MIVALVVIFSVFYVFQINRMTLALVTSREIPEENHEKIFRTINILILILLLTLYVGVEFTP
ncbi:hypothetical protein [Planococcus maritimus]|uniref:hypothetical protein n=1 Tax=Planococcus maritimus TaxID=192421 RepID=UPI00079B84C0|nr:hypothetical protein [Planococcus maritimus]ANU16648.1 hypothetical protein BBI11_06185 [Planococcus maritimus]KYG57513.1 hypothetical protein AY633_13415 [Planococcus maritimus]OED31354.1 hypothetical protein BHE17_01705 [Planococcus maritimus]